LLEILSNFPGMIQVAVKVFFSGMKEDREHLFLMDILRSLFFVAIAAVAVWLLLKNKISSKVALIVIGLFAFIDLVSIDSKYLTSEMYQDKEEYEMSNFDPKPEDQQILQDKSYYRVLDLRYGGIQGAFNQGAMTAYFHKSIGGYHPAKLSLYQDLIEKQLYKFPNCMPVINMLNTKYVINVGEGNVPQVIPNPQALGAAWFVNEIKWVNGAKEEMAALDSLQPKQTVVIDRSFEKIANQPFTFDSSATIQLQKNDNDVMVYGTKSASPQFAVFSEVYYDKGWKAFIDGKEAEFVKANYVLRAMPIPAGAHTIEFRFEPQSHKIGSTVTIICSVLMLVLLGFGFWQTYKRKEVFVDKEI